MSDSVHRWRYACHQKGSPSKRQVFARCWRNLSECCCVLRRGPVALPQVFLGGLLALFSYRWLKNSAAAAINLSIGGARPQLSIVQFVLRYIVIGAIVFAAYRLNLVSLPAVLFGLASFVVAFLRGFERVLFRILSERKLIDVV